MGQYFASVSKIKGGWVVGGVIKSVRIRLPPSPKRRPPGGRVLPPSIAPFVSKKPVPRTESAAYRTHWSTCVPQDPPPAEVRFLHVAGDHVVHLLPALAVTWPILDISGSAPTPVGVFLFFYDTLLTYTLAAIFLKGWIKHRRGLVNRRGCKKCPGKFRCGSIMDDKTGRYQFCSGFVRLRTIWWNTKWNF